MAEYKRKKRGALKSAPRFKKNKVKNRESVTNIEMRPQNAQKPQGMKVVKGKRLEQKRKIKLLTYTACILAVVFVICELIMPAGVFETLSNSFATLGTGKYPIELDSNDTVNVISEGSYYYVLTDKRLNAVSNSGKVIYSYEHGYENPVLKTSKTRALIFDQGKSKLSIFNLNGLQFSEDYKFEILNASISDNGTYALISNSSKYACEVNVYKKNGKLEYQWFSANEMINNVAVSKNGKKIAVSTLSSKVGGYNSKVSILNFKSANAEYTKEFENTIVYSIESSLAGGFSVLSENSYNYISWRGKNVTEYTNEYTANIQRNSPSGSVLVFNRESDKTDNRIVFFSKRGRKKAEIEFKGIITDITFKGNNFYCLSNTDLYVIDKEGKILGLATVGFGVQRITVNGQNRVAAVTDNTIVSIKIK